MSSAQQIFTFIELVQHDSNRQRWGGLAQQICSFIELVQNDSNRQRWGCLAQMLGTATKSRLDYAAKHF
jgi:hypothetical protein